MIPVHPAAPPQAYVQANRYAARCLSTRAGAVIVGRNDYQGSLDADLGNGRWVHVEWILDRGRVIGAFNEGNVSPWQEKVVNRCEAEAP